MADGDRTGTTFGRYEVGELLGRGGMGEVYRAVDTEKDRTVALKLLPAVLAGDDTYAERFRRESRTVARLGEPHIIPIHDFGEIDGTLFLDMRLVEGADLRAAIRGSGKLAPARVVAVVEQVAAALDAAHDAGLVHRDVKPENILLTPNDFAYLVDFGIARAADGAEPHLTQLGTAIGSVAYLAPELFDDREATAASDVYGLAVVAYESLTGRVPHPGATQASAIKSALLTDPPPPSSLDPSLPLGFDEVVMRGLARDPAHRYATAGEFAAAARAALDTASAWSPTTVTRFPAAAAPAGVTAETPVTAAPLPNPSGPVTHPSGPVYPTGPMYHPQQRQGPSYGRGAITAIVAVIATLVVAGGAFAVWTLWSSGRDGPAPTTAPVTVTETASATTTTGTPPPDSVPCDSTVGVGSTMTTCPFAAAVRDAYLAAGAKGEARTVNAFSPATGRSYSMSCVPEQGIVVCRGGDNAVVHIY